MLVLNEFSDNHNQKKNCGYFNFVIIHFGCVQDRQFVYCEPKAVSFLMFVWRIIFETTRLMLNIVEFSYIHFIRTAYQNSMTPSKNRQNNYLIREIWCAC